MKNMYYIKHTYDGGHSCDVHVFQSSKLWAQLPHINKLAEMLEIEFEPELLETLDLGCGSVCDIDRLL